MNEAELQANYSQRIKEAFPWLPTDVKLEHHLNLILGHNEIKINGASPQKGTTSGRYDILVSNNDEPILLIELKAPNIEITDRDCDQALSYARLLKPTIAPLTVVTNGNQHFFMNTYTGVSLDNVNSIDQLKSIIKSAGLLASNHISDAVNTLLGSDFNVWKELFSKFNKSSIDSNSGELRDLTKPLARGFGIPRLQVPLIRKKISSDKVIVVHGPPLSGITNILHQICESDCGLLMLYIDSNCSGNIFQYISNILKREFKIPSTKDDVQNWLINGLSLIKPVFVLDGIPSSGMEELLSMAENNEISLVLGLNSNIYKKTKSNPGRQQLSYLGKLASEIEVVDLTQKEIQAANILLYKNFGAAFTHGYLVNPELKRVRTLRALTSTIPPKEPNKILQLSSVFSINELMSINNRYSENTELLSDFKKIATLYLKTLEIHKSKKKDSFLDLWGEMFIDQELAETDLGPILIEKLTSQGYLSLSCSNEKDLIYNIRFEEFTCCRISYLWAEEISKSSNLKETINKLIKLSEVIHSGDVTLAYAIMLSGKTNDNILSQSVSILRNNEPIVQNLSKDTEVVLVATDAKIPYTFTKDDDILTISNMTSWCILSHLASLPMEVVDQAVSGNGMILGSIGDFHHTLRSNFRYKFREVPMIHYHEVGELGLFPCTDSGIFEPVLQSLFNYINYFPKECLNLTHEAITLKKIHLLWRLLTVAKQVKDSTSSEVSSVAQQIIVLINPIISATLHEDLENLRVKERTLVKKKKKNDKRVLKRKRKQSRGAKK